MGTQLMAGGAPMDSCLEELCVSNADLVRGVHEKYLAAGARVIETNSFGANAVRLAKHGLAHHVNEINWSAAQIAKDCARGKGVYVAGSVGPLGITEAEAMEQGIDREDVFREQIGALLDGGVNLIILETFTDLDELALALYVKQSLHHCPAVCSLACSDEGLLPSGMKVEEAFAKLREQDAEVVGLNCVNGPQAMVRLFETIETGDLLFSAYPNAGVPSTGEGRPAYDLTPDAFAESALRLARCGVRLIGGCCGVGPEHIAAMVRALKEGSGAASEG